LRGGDKNGRKETKLWVRMYRAKTKKQKNESHRKETQKVQVIHKEVACKKKAEEVANFLCLSCFHCPFPFQIFFLDKLSNLL
jgi:hypothetical protein